MEDSMRDIRKELDLKKREEEWRLEQD